MKWFALETGEHPFKGSPVGRRPAWSYLSVFIGSVFVFRHILHKLALPWRSGTARGCQPLLCENIVDVWLVCRRALIPGCQALCTDGSSLNEVYTWMFSSFDRCLQMNTCDTEKQNTKSISLHQDQLETSWSWRLWAKLPGGVPPSVLPASELEQEEGDKVEEL